MMSKHTRHGDPTNDFVLFPIPDRGAEQTFDLVAHVIWAITLFKNKAKSRLFWEKNQGRVNKEAYKPSRGSAGPW